MSSNLSFIHIFLLSLLFSTPSTLDSSIKDTTEVNFASSSSVQAIEVFSSDGNDFKGMVSSTPIHYLDSKRKTVPLEFSKIKYQKNESSPIASKQTLEIKDNHLQVVKSDMEKININTDKTKPFAISTYIHFPDGIMEDNTIIWEFWHERTRIINLPSALGLYVNKNGELYLKLSRYSLSKKF